MQLDIFHILLNAPLPVKFVVGVLALQAILSLAVILDRTFMLAASSRRNGKFARSVDRSLEAGDFARARDVAARTKGSHLADYMKIGIGTYLDKRTQGIPEEKALHLTERALERAGETLSANLNRGMGVLASTGSTAPFVGLLGTVLGILFTFQKIAAEGGGGIATIGGEIGEALVVTGLGLVVAIPVVLAFNALSGRIALYEAGLSNAAKELVDKLSVSDTSRVAEVQAALPSVTVSAPERRSRAEAAGFVVNA